MNLNNGSVRSRSMSVFMGEITFSAGAANHAAGSSSSLNFTNLINLATGVREARTVTVTVGASAVSAATLADMWVAALTQVLPTYGGVVFRQGGVYGNFVLAFPYPDEAPFPGCALVHSGHFTALSGFTLNNPVLTLDLDAAEKRFTATAAIVDSLEHDKEVLELQLARAGAGTGGGAGSTSVVVNNPATNTTQTVMAAIAGFGIGFMVRGARREEE